MNGPKAPPAGRPRMRKPLQRKIPAVLPKSLKPFAAPEGASPFTVNSPKTTAEDLRKVIGVAGPLDRELLIHLYVKTQNPVWLWADIAASKGPEDLSTETFAYLRQAAGEIYAGVVKRTRSLEKVQIVPGADLEVGIVRAPLGDGPDAPTVEAILGLSQPGKNLMDSAARDIRDISYAVAVEDLVRKMGVTRSQAYAEVATYAGRISPETGPSSASIKKMATDGKKLISGRSIKRWRRGISLRDKNYRSGTYLEG